MIKVNKDLNDLTKEYEMIKKYMKSPRIPIFEKKRIFIS